MKSVGHSAIMRGHGHGGETMAKRPQSDPRSPQECDEEGQQRCGILQDHPTAPRSKKWMGPWNPGGCWAQRWSNSA